LEELQGVLSGQGIDLITKKLAETVIKDQAGDGENAAGNPFMIMYSKAMACFQEIKDVSFVIGNCVFKLTFEVPDLFQKFNVPVSLTGAAEFDSEKFPANIRTSSHEHELELLPKVYGGMGYGCDKCSQFGSGHVYHCDLCQYDMHPQCALDDAS